LSELQLRRVYGEAAVYVESSEAGMLLQQQQWLLAIFTSST
jgi:hypothetical protein